MTTLLLDTRLDSTQRRYLGIIRSSSEALLTIINDILDFSKIEAQKLSLEAIDFDLPTLLEELAELNGLRATEVGLDFSWQLDPDVPRRLRGDPGRIRQILTNLIGNSLKFTTAGTIALRVSRGPDRAGRVVLHIEVEDTGIGISSDKLEKIFAPFEQADSSTTRKYGGTGLGLSITRQLVELMDGTIRVDSQENRGTTFSLEIALEAAADVEPVAAKQLPDELLPAGIERPAANSAARLLVVEDNPVNMMVMQGVLAKLGYDQLDRATDGAEALEAALHGKHELILMDCQMPKMDGYEVTRRLRAEGVRTPVIAMTAHVGAGDRERCLAAGMDDYLGKPLEIDKLALMLRQWLSSASDQSAAMSDPATVFKYADFLKLMMGDADLAASLVRMFVTNTPGDIGKLQAAIAGGDGAQVRSAAHFIKGAAANLCAPGINAVALEIEQAGMHGDIARAVGLMPRLASSWQEFLRHPKVVECLAGE